MSNDEAWLDDLLGTTPTLTPTPTPTPTATPYEMSWAEKNDLKQLRKLGKPEVPLSDAPLPSFSGHEPSPYLAPEVEVLRIQLKEQIHEARKAERKAERTIKRVKEVLKPVQDEYDPTHFGTPVETTSVDTRNPEPLQALADGQKLIANAEEGFPTAPFTSLAPDVKMLDERERKFVGLLFNGMPAEEAAERAGYPQRQDLVMALVGKPHIRKALDWMQQEYLRSIGATLTNAVTQMTHIAFLDPRKVVNMETGKPIPLHELDKATAAALEGVEITETDFNGVSKITKTKYKFNSKLKALQQLGDHLGLFNQVVKVEHTGADGGPIQMEMSQTEIARRMLFVLRQQGQVIDVDMTAGEG